jgi:hypothetical protein
LDEYELERELPAKAAKSAATSGGTVAERIKAALQAKGKMLVLSALDHAESITSESNNLRIKFAGDGVAFKNQIDSYRRILEEAAREVLGGPVTLTVTAGEPEPPAVTSQPTTGPEESAEKHPAVRALLDTFHGELIDVTTKPE